MMMKILLKVGVKVLSACKNNLQGFILKRLGSGRGINLVQVDSQKHVMTGIAIVQNLLLTL